MKKIQRGRRLEDLVVQDEQDQEHEHSDNSNGDKFLTFSSAIAGEMRVR